jgi:hypothetical protein
MFCVADVLCIDGYIHFMKCTDIVESPPTARLLAALLPPGLGEGLLAVTVLGACGGSTQPAAAVAPPRGGVAVVATLATASAAASTSGVVQVSSCSFNLCLTTLVLGQQLAH